ncbi:LysR family transcriptional regulator, partial [Arthrobacter sp. GCM10027362]|uniref:LysR family transcriptional regulator n=1 Tax=Arthrobacter sp. GCM10027362 TaxID=3273379 RepID=UPI0036394A68
MNEFQLDHLATFAAVVEHGTFDAAARRLHVTPSAVSQRIKAMEQAAGRVLLQRTAPVQPTAAGEAVV